MLKSIEMHMVLVFIWMALIRLRTVGTLPVESKESALDFILLHNNDLHGRFAESTIDRSDCRPEEALANKCYGGFARISTLVKRYRSDAEKENGLPVLYLNAGDTYTGTPLFHLFKDKITTEFMNVLKPDVGALGNHEFDLGLNGLSPFLKNISFPIAVANLNISTDHPLWQTQALERSVVFNVKGFKVGVIGYILPEAKTMSKTEDVEFLPEIGAINAEAERLQKQGVNIFIALGHSGYEKDQEIAKECPLIDIVVGAHSHTLLYTGTPPDPRDIPLGPYPTVVEQESGKKVPVVQAYAWSKYLGKLKLSFDNEGNLLRWDGSPILLDNQIPRDPEVLELLAKYRPAIEELTNDVLGISKVELANNNCTNYECNIGNLITDSWVYSRAKQYNGTSGWTDASISFVNAGAIRSAATIGDLSQFSLTTVLPFNNTLFVVQVPGRIIREALEYTVKDYVVGGYVRGFLQMSGVHVVYNVNKPLGQRLQSVEVLCSDCSTPSYEPLDEDKVYGVILESYIYTGGDGYTMFDSLKGVSMNVTSLDSVRNYIKHMEWIYPAVEGRIKFISQNSSSTSQSASSITTPISIALITVSLIFSQFLTIRSFM